ncbi:hypothetical protein [Streptomyces sp. CC228A]|uniref:hypothetical protein n=1 Tax=Streptomyces sp. CC228A TaxID=2898186 RepID=UPI001F2FB7AC|nr:hypothetical protein [Streptomyces sp. CC228A]
MEDMSEHLTARARVMSKQSKVAICNGVVGLLIGLGAVAVALVELAPDAPEYYPYLLAAFSAVSSGATWIMAGVYFGRLGKTFAESSRDLTSARMQRELLELRLAALVEQERQMKEAVSDLRKGFEVEKERLREIREEREYELKWSAYRAGLDDRLAVEAYLRDRRHGLRALPDPPSELRGA